MVEVKDLTKRYGDKLAVDDISFTVKDGEILGFLGPNGAGKTTTMNIITGYTSSSRGTVTVNDAEILQDPIKVKKQIGYLPEHPPLYPDMTVEAYLAFLYDLKKVDREKYPKKEHIDGVCDVVKIRDVQKRIIKNLSKGYQQRVGLAQALLGNPDLLVLDEPTVGLDPKQIIEIRNLIKSLGKRHTIILSSHILSEVQATCERVIVINRGKIIADGDPESLSRTLEGDMRLTMRIEGPQNEVYKLLAGIPEMARVDKMGQREGKYFDYVLHAKPGEDIRLKVSTLLAQRGWGILSMRSAEMNLEDIFLRLTEGGSLDEEAGGRPAGKAGKRKKIQAEAETADGSVTLIDSVVVLEEVDAIEETPAEAEAPKKKGGKKKAGAKPKDETKPEGGDEA